VPDLPNCPPARGPRDNRDLEEIVGPPEETFEPKDADGPYPIDIDDYDLNQQALESIRVHTREVERIDTGGWFAPISRMIRPTSNMLQDVQRETGVPYWTWLRAVELGRRDADIALSEPSYSIIPEIFRKASRQDDEAVQELLELAGNEEGKALLMRSLKPEKRAHIQAMHDEMWKLYGDYFGKMDFSAEDVADIFTNFVPGIRKAGGDYAKFSNVRTPGKITKMVERAVRTGEAPIDRETRASVIAKTLFRAAATEKYLAPHWNHVTSQFKLFADQMSPQMSEIFLNYLHQVRHAPDTTQLALAESMRRLVTKLDGKRGFKKVSAVLSMEDWKDLVTMGVQWNHFANLAWNPGAVLRQLMQPFQTVMPDMGVNNTLAAMKKTVGWFRDEKMQKYYESRGVISRNAMHEQFREVQQSLRQFSGEGLSGQAKEAFQFFQDKGTFAFKTADDATRIISYESMMGHAKPHIKRFVEGKTTWVEFRERSKLDRLDEAEGPFTQVVRGLLAEGNVEQAAHEMAFKFMNDTAFVYTRGNNPYFMSSTVGRFLGQYGTWPIQYVEYMRNMAKRGSQKNRITAFSRWLGVNGAMVAGASSVLGVDMTKWSFFSPFGYQGGPFMDLTQQGLATVGLVTSGQVDVGKSWEKTKENWLPTIAGTKDADLMDKLQAARFGPNAVQQVIPFPWGQRRRTMEAMELMWNADVAEATKRFLGFPSTTPPPK
jgi:hypothetical protein